MNSDEDDDAVLGPPPPVPEDVWERTSAFALSAPDGSADLQLVPPDPVDGDATDGHHDWPDAEQPSAPWADDDFPLDGPGSLLTDDEADHGEPGDTG